MSRYSDPRADKLADWAAYRRPADTYMNLNDKSVIKPRHQVKHTHIIARGL